VRLTGATFSDTGFLDVQSLELSGTTVPAGGLNTTYGLFYQFTGTGTQLAGKVDESGSSYAQRIAALHLHAGAPVRLWP
jgi:hypothetical protein